ncbi:MAG TPA: hypothetical protein VEW46_14845 [Pyrinomonadaceae bacterium]|nr:hypothetical protein [Pyrinomonadaceae bacterium]
MFRKTLIRLSTAIAIGFLLMTSSVAQDDKLVYVLTKARANVDRPECRVVIVQNDSSAPIAACREIEILFGKSFPGKEEVERTKNWLLIAIGEDGKRREFEPQSIDANETEKLAILRLAPDEDLNPKGSLDRATHRIIIVYQQQNLPTVTLGQLKKKGAQKIFTAAKGKKDADIYLSGSATGQRGSGPIYSIDAKAGYLQSLKRAGAIGARATFVADEGSDIDPDSITATATYQKIFVVRSPWGFILNSDFLGGEFDRENTTRNVTTGLDGTLVLPSAKLGETNYATMDFMGGFEAGYNYEHPLNPKGLGNFWRPKVGVNAYFVALKPRIFQRVNISANYLLRLPRSAEPFTEKINGTKVTSLTTRPRHHVGIDLGLMFTSSYGLTISYRHGSLPPAFKFVDNKVSVGFTLQLKQANK